jgi:hypothetical protein
MHHYFMVDQTNTTLSRSFLYKRVFNEIIFRTWIWVFSGFTNFDHHHCFWRNRRIRCSIDAGRAFLRELAEGFLINNAYFQAFFISSSLTPFGDVAVLELRLAT